MDLRAKSCCFERDVCVHLYLFVFICIYLYLFVFICIYLYIFANASLCAKDMVVTQRGTGARM